MEEQVPNYLLEQENFYAGYQKKIDELKHDPKVVSFDKLCFEVFEANPTGKKFIELIRETVLLPRLVQMGPEYGTEVIWQEGFKDAYRQIINCVTAHKQRIAAGDNKK